MRPTPLTVLVMLLASILPLLAQDTSAVPRIDPGELEALIDARVQAEMETAQIPGLVVAVTQGERVLLLKGYGVTNLDSREPVDPERHLFRVASVSKPFAWMSLVQLADRGALDLDDEINAYLPFQFPDTFPGNPIRIRHLITHTSGLEAHNLGASARSLEQLLPLGTALARHLPRRIAPPGTQTGYSNYGAALGGYIVELVTGIPYADYLQQEIFVPLGMTRTTIRQTPDDRLLQDVVTGYSSGEEGPVAGSFEYMNHYPDGAVSTTAADMARFAIAQLNPERASDVMSAEAFATMHRRQFGNLPQVSGLTYGFEEELVNGRRAIGHGGDISLFQAKLFMLPDEGVSIFLAANSNDFDDARTAIVQAFMDRFFPGPDDHYLFSDAPIDNATDDVAGRYVSSRRNETTLEKIIWPLLTGVTVWEADDDALSVFFFGETARYVRVEQGVYVPAPETGTRYSWLGALLATEEPETGRHRIHFSQIGSFSFEERGALSSPAVHFWLIIAVLLVGLIGTVITLIAVLRDRASWPPALKAGSVALTVAPAAAFAFLVFVANHMGVELINGVSTTFARAFWLPLIGVGLATLGGVSLVVLWSHASLRLRIGGVTVLAAIAVYAWQLNMWNMLGFGGIVS